MAIFQQIKQINQRGLARASPANTTHDGQHINGNERTHLFLNKRKP